MNPVRLLTRTSFAAAVAGVALCAASGALQAQPDYADLIKPPAPNRDPSLREILPRLRWNVEQSGPLLIVAPGETWAPPQTSTGDGEIITKRAPAPAPSADGYRLADLAEPFARKIVRCGSLHVFAPTQMVVFNTDPPKPTAELALRPEDRFPVLLSTFTPAQWRAITEPAGIGRGDLTEKQQKIWEGLLPNPLVLKHARPSDAFVSEEDEAEDVPVSATARSQMRLSLFQTLRVAIYSTYENGGSRSSGVYLPPPTDRHQPGWKVKEDRYAEQNWLLQTMTREVPATLKPGDLAFDWEGLNAEISLVDAPNVGELIRRVARATNLELHCDPRYAVKTVWLRGQTARSGDVLKGLCHALTATWRKVGPAYVLTDDREGLGTRHARLSAWLHALEVLRDNQRVQARVVLSKPENRSQIKFAPSDPYLPNEAMRKAMQASKPDRMGYLQALVAIRNVPALMRQLVEAARERHREESRDPRNFPPFEVRDEVTVGLETHVTLLLPNLPPMLAPHSLQTRFLEPRPARVGAVPTAPAPAPGPFFLSPKISPRAVVVSLPPADDLSRLLETVQAAGFNELWLQVETAEPDAIARLKAAIAQGQTRKIAVRAVVRAFRAPESGAADQTLMGGTSTEFYGQLAESPAQSPLEPRPSSYRLRIAQAEDARRQVPLGPWLAPDAPDTQTARAAEIEKIAALSGLAGLVVKNLIPPGYGTSPEWEGLSEGLLPYHGGDLGYTEAKRLAFLRRFHTDPVDIERIRTEFDNLSSTQGRTPNPFTLPFFERLPPTSEGGRTDQDWRQFRLDVQRAASNQLLGTIKKAHPNLPLLVSLDPDNPTRQRHYPSLHQTTFRSIDEAETPLKDSPPYALFELPPPQTPEEWSRRTHRDHKQVLSAIEFFNMAGNPPSNFPSAAATMNAFLQPHHASDGLAVDYSRFDFADALTQIRRYKPGTPPTMKP